jgi:amino acid transporter
MRSQWLTCAVAVVGDVCHRPAVILSYVVAGVSATLSSLCYAEFTANMSLSGGAYS